MNGNWQELTGAFRRELGIYQLILRDKRTPVPAKFFLWLAAGYLLLPFDLVPDFIPVLGQLDDLIIVPCLVFIALKLIPKELVAEYRNVHGRAVTGSLASYNDHFRHVQDA